MFEGLFQPTHLFLILAVALLVFGPSKLPEIGAGLGKSIRDFKKAMAEVNDDAPPAARAKELPAPPVAMEVAAPDATETKKA
ncbi:MAG: twin-arginine translocase TatA/TatE family subunit [Deltaproteobacteria bacterium]